MSHIAIVNGRILTMDPDRRVLEPGTVVVEDQHISAIGPPDEVQVPHDATVIDGAGKAVLPGFVNTHSHVPQILLRGGASHDRGLLDWLFNVLYPGLAVYTPEDVRAATLLYCAEALRAGITTVVDNEDISPADFARVGKAAIDGFTDAGIRAVYARMFFDMARPELDDLLGAIMAKESAVHHVSVNASLDRSLDGLEQLIRHHHGSAGGRIQIWPGPSIPFLLSEKGIHASQRLAREHDTMWTMHVSEDAIERQVHWMNTPEFLHNTGCLDDRLLAAHCVHIGERDIRFFGQHKVKVSTQPVSNSYLAAGVAPVPALLTAGVTVGIGTDDANCNDSVNLISDMKVLALLHRAVHSDASIITPEKILEMATIDGARAVGMASDIGSIEVGKKADLITLDLRTPQTTPAHDLAATIVFQAYGSEVDNVLVDGQIVMRDRRLRFLEGRDEAAFLADAASRSVRVLRDSGIAGSRSWRTVGR
jgi:atrazine chlorohydrolase/5-methylthioadenosine/S-adenosylhomocysteine deaminase/melamine deaminase